VGIIHGDSKANPHAKLNELIQGATKFGLNLADAQPIEYHFGLIPSDGPCERFVGNGVMAVGDAAGQPSALVGEGIRWAIRAGRLAGTVAVNAISRDNCSRAFLADYEKQWQSKYGKNLRIAYTINKKIARWTDAKWDVGVGMLKLLTPDQFAQALQSNFIAFWPLHVLSRNPRLIKKGVEQLVAEMSGRSRASRVPRPTA
jgi:digeranylgeranylglycerophospholipid reductase